MPVDFPFPALSATAAKRRGALSKKIKMENSVTPTQKFKVYDGEAAPHTAPSKMMGNDDILHAASSPSLRAAALMPSDFDIWEDPDLVHGDSDQDSLVPLDGKMTFNEVPEEDQDHGFSVPNKENLDPVNHADLGISGPSVNVPLSNLPYSLTSGPRSALGEVKVSGMAEHQALIGQAFKIVCSPNLYGLRSPQFKVPLGHVSYGKELPPPSKLTRTIGSGKFRATSINLFASAKGSTLVMDTKSPSTPHRIPELVHSTRITKRLFAANPNVPSMNAVNAESVKDPSQKSDPPKKNLPSELLSGPITVAVYNLRPRSKPGVAADGVVPNHNVKRRRGTTEFK